MAIIPWIVGPSGRFSGESAEHFAGRKIKDMGIKTISNMPKGWKEIKGASNLRGYKWVSNGKSRFSGEYEHALLIV